MDIDKLIRDDSISDELRLSLVEKRLTHQIEQQRLELETRKSRFSTPLAVALTGLITLSGNFIFDALRSEQESQETITLEQVKSTISDTLAESESLRVARAANRSFQYEIMQTELSRSSDAVERAKALLFLTEAGLLDGLEVQKLRNWATGSLASLGIETDTLEVPALNTSAPLKGFSIRAPSSILAAIEAKGIPGYDPSFLSLELPLPKHPDAGRRLDFARFTVEMDRERRYARIAVSNVDGSQRISVERPDNFSEDPRLSDTEQLELNFFRGSGLDRGHLVDTRSVSWGDELTSKVAIASIFLMPNVVPQAPMLNRRDWRNLEGYVATKIDNNDMRATIFSGPIFTDEDPEHRSVQIPRAFWKIVVAERTDGTYEVGAFLVSQNRHLLEMGLESVPTQPSELAGGFIGDVTYASVMEMRVDPGELIDFVGYQINLPSNYTQF